MSVRAFVRPGGPIRWLDAGHDVVCHPTTDFGSGSRNVGLGCRFLGRTRSRSDYYWGRTARRQYLRPPTPLNTILVRQKTGYSLLLRSVEAYFGVTRSFPDPVLRLDAPGSRFGSAGPGRPGPPFGTAPRPSSLGPLIRQVSSGRMLWKNRRGSAIVGPWIASLAPCI